MLIHSTCFLKLTFRSPEQNDTKHKITLMSYNQRYSRFFIVISVTWMHVSFIFKDNCHQNVYHHDILIVACACKQSLILHCLNKLNVTMNIRRSKSEGAIISLGVSEVCVYSCWCNTLTSYSVYNHRQLSSLFDNLLRSTETKRQSSTLLTSYDVIMQLFIGLDFSNNIFTPRTSGRWHIYF